MRLRPKQFALDGKRVGVISDTHGLMRPEALGALKGSDAIIHAGDIGKPEVLEALGAIAPVVAIRGNNDRGPWAKNLPDMAHVQIGGVKVLVIHNVRELPGRLRGGEFGVIVSGHSHKPSLVEREGTLFLNPGSAGPRRFKLPVAVAQLKFDGGHGRAKIIELKV